MLDRCSLSLHCSTFTDGASIPQVFTALVGDPNDPSFANAAALQDAYCGKGNEDLSQFHSRTWEETHRMFYDSLLVNGTPAAKAKIMFAAVYLAGPRRGDPTRSLDGVQEVLLLQEMEWCVRFIQKVDPSRAEIEAWMSKREAGLLSGNPVEPTSFG